MARMHNNKHGNREGKLKKFYFKKKKKDLTLTFDETARKEFLTGFRKRKLERKRKAQEELEGQLKEERKRIKKEAKEVYKKFVVSHRPIPELENLLSEKIELDNHSVSITELSHTELAKMNNWIGVNQIEYEDNKKEEDNKESESEEEISGMELKPKKPKKMKVQDNTEKPVFKSKKDLKRLVKNEATKKVQKSKIFQRKEKIQRMKNVQKTKKAEIRREKNRAKANRRRNKPH